MILTRKLESENQSIDNLSFFALKLLLFSAQFEANLSETQSFSSEYHWNDNALLILFFPHLTGDLDMSQMDGSVLHSM